MYSCVFFCWKFHLLNYTIVQDNGIKKLKCVPILQALVGAPKLLDILYRFPASFLALLIVFFFFRVFFLICVDYWGITWCLWVCFNSGVLIYKVILPYLYRCAYIFSSCSIFSRLGLFRFASSDGCCC